MLLNLRKEGCVKMNEKEAIYRFVHLTDEIEKRYGPLDWIDLTLHVEEARGSIGFGNNTKAQSTLKFFNECRQIKDFINAHEDHNAEMISFEPDADCPYAEVIINFTLDGSEL